MTEWIHRHRYALIASFLPACFFLAHFVAGQFINSFDTMNLFYVTKRIFFREILHGHFPLWNEYLFTGYNQLTNPSTAVSSPFSALFYFIFSGPLAEQLQVPLFAAFAGWGMYLWLKKITASPDVALAIALAFAFCGPLLSLVDRSHIFYSLCLYPWAFLWQMELSENKRGRLGCLAATLALVIIYGDWVAFCLGAVLLLAVSRNVKVLASVIWALGLATLAFLPTLLSVSGTTRAGFTLEQTSFYSFHPLRLVNFLIPDLWGQPYATNFYGQDLANGYKVQRFWFHSIFLGVPVFALAIRGLRELRVVKNGWLIFTVTVGCLALAFGKYFFVHELLYEILPGYSKLRFPEKFLLYACIAFFPLAALTATKIRVWRPWFLTFAAIHGMVCVLVLALPASLAHLDTFSLAAHVFMALGFIGLALKCPAQWAVTGLSAAIAIEMMAFAPAFPWSPMSAFEEQSPFTEALKTGRYVRDQNLDSFAGDHALRGLEPNLPSLLGLREVFGYEASTPERMQKLVGNEVFANLGAWAPVLNLTHVVATIKPRAPVLKLASEKGWLSPEATDDGINAVLLAVHRTSKDFDLLCRFEVVSDATQAFARVQTRVGAVEPVIVEAPDGFDPSPTACGDHEIHTKSQLPEFHDYDLQIASPMWLVERAAYDGAWMASVDGQPVPLFHLDFANRGVRVPAGKHYVQLYFAPPGFVLAFWISLCSALALLLYGLVTCAKSTIAQLTRST
jgi:hypothetical protein